MSVVSNASPRISLARIGQLDLVHELYGELTIPEAVWREVVVEGAGQPGAAELQGAPWIDRCPDEAKRKGLIGRVKPMLDALRDAAGFRVSDALHTRVLEDEGET